MSSEWDETCLVCGTKTKNRCAKCAAAGISLFFCSADHQKLVWKVHKRVCGPTKANPFVYPLLSKDESGQILEHMHDSSGQLSRFPQQTSTVAKALQHFLQIPGRELRDCIRTVTEGGPNELVTPDIQRRVLVIARAHENARTLDLRHIVTSPVANPFGNLASWDWYSARDTTEASTMRWGDEPWRSWYRHAMLVYLYLMDQCRREPNSPETTTRAAWLERLVERNDTFIRTTIAPTCPHLADSMLETALRVKDAMQMLGMPTGPV
ncbi:hypothetical protein JCM3775_005844 [Rhodotorula graminis]|uniref:MYND-type domain-containing protein n=1 Tax=Rhodotorula graminis (strain WP1) TaxID=578459 RepID=A0A194S794_RHOGW|nr:uncharacterized protein RHOBADRAFT_43776 [Rhodotorula graminis WP1]KPV75286.1 hypothetical protein RHOBADRAFT_43776 [Rhodotorula graminis WP1]